MTKRGHNSKLVNFSRTNVVFFVHVEFAEYDEIERSKFLRIILSQLMEYNFQNGVNVYENVYFITVKEDFQLDE